MTERTVMRPADVHICRQAQVMVVLLTHNNLHLCAIG